MTTKQLFAEIGSVDADLVAEAGQAWEQRKKQAIITPIFRTVAALAACFALVIGVGIYNRVKEQPIPQIYLQPAIVPAMITDGELFNYHGYLYAFCNYGATYDFSQFQLTKPLGTLIEPTEAGPSGDAQLNQNFATTFRAGATLYEIPGYDPAFRLAVFYNGSYSMAELVGNADGTPLDAAYYFRVSKLRSLVDTIEIFAGQEHIIKNADAKKLIDLFSRAVPAQPPATINEENGVPLILRLRDSTDIEFYLFPQHGLLKIGTNYYTIDQKQLEAILSASL